MFSLVDQMRRAAASIGMNLVEGSRRLNSREYRQFVSIARGSAGEVCYQLLLARIWDIFPKKYTATFEPNMTGSSKCSPA
jgi:four helix bundle protein